ncbi:MAG: 4-alpha-glucanotransferase [Lachnospiraceae bacterium]|nr:4-alpha-glucanotransferase [Lachnospiraceae bacterium]
MRRSGVLMAVSSLPGKYGIGCFSKEAYKFVDDLKEAGQSLWQILPLGPTSYGDSPYQSFSTFAGNPYFIDPDTLIAKKWLTKRDCESYDWGKDETRVDYAKIYYSRFKLLRRAYKRSKIASDRGFLRFIKANAFWLPDYALFMALKDAHGGKSWETWEKPLRFREKAAIDEARRKYADDIGFYEFIQYEFSLEWKELKKYANKQGIEIVGDIPIYVAFDSADAWANPKLFEFDEELRPVAVAGCPPDAFSADGQLWGNPLYRWDVHKKSGYAWWMKRIENCFKLYDVVRIDHFRGFDEYYRIPYPAENARNGKWMKGPGFDLFKVMKRKLGEKQVIAEDLGFLTPSVLKLVARTGYPGMKVLQFAFDPREESDYLPQNYVRNSVVYTGTHDNDTTLSWYYDISARDRRFAAEYLNIPKNAKDKDIPWYFIRSAYASVSDTAVIPMQDILSLPHETRMNHPSTIGGNWQWRMKEGAFKNPVKKKLLRLTELYGRAQKPNKSKKR